MADYSQLFKINHNVTAAQIKRSAILLLPMGLFIAVGSGALLALVLGVPIPAFLMPDSMRIMFTMLALLIVAGFIASGMQGVRFGTLNA